jgi:hypothetical protein
MMPIANVFNLQGPDFIVIATILAVLATPALIALPIIFVIHRRSKKPPPLAIEVQSPQK